MFRSRSGGNEWEALTKGLPQKDCYVNVLRDAMAIDSLDSCGVYFGTTGGQVYASADAGDTWTPIVRDLPPVLSVEVQTLPRRVHHDPSAAARASADARACAGEVQVDVTGPATLRSVLDALEARIPCCAGRSANTTTLKRRPFVRFFACEEDLSHEPPDTPLPDAVARGVEPFLVVGAMAGG